MLEEITTEITLVTELGNDVNIIIEKNAIHELNDILVFDLFKGFNLVLNHSEHETLLLSVTLHAYDLDAYCVAIVHIFAFINFTK